MRPFPMTREPYNGNECPDEDEEETEKQVEERPPAGRFDPTRCTMERDTIKS